MELLAMRSDESKAKREIDRDKLEAHLRSYSPGQYIAILDWYDSMEKLGLTHSNRQRVSDLRKERGLIMEFDKAKKAYHYMGFHPSGQLPLIQEAA